MTLEKRLDQLESVVAEVLAQLDCATAQNRKRTVGVNQIVESIVQQLDNTQFLLHEAADFKTEVNHRFDAVDRRFDAVEAKVDLILQLLQSVNGRH